MFCHACAILSLLLALPLTLAGGEPRAALQTRLLNAMETPDIPGLAAQRVDALKVRIASGVEARCGNVAIEISGAAQGDGKVDAPVFHGELNGCRKLAVWVYVTDASNAKAVGFQISDARKESFLQTVAVGWRGWKRIEIDPLAGGMIPGEEQNDQDGKVDMPITSVNLIWYTRGTGPTSLIFDGLTACTAPEPGADGVRFTALGNNVFEPGLPLAVHFGVENTGATSKTVNIRSSLQANPTFADPAIPDPVQGYDQAVGCRCTWSVDGIDKGPSKVCDGDDFSNDETAWGKGYSEALVNIDLGQVRTVSAVRWNAGDANWVFKADLAASTDHAAWRPIDGAQGVTMQGRWGPGHDVPIARPFEARYLRFRFHNDGKTSNCIRIPPTIMVYDGIANDSLAIPTVGHGIGSGKVQCTIPAHDFAELVVAGTEALPPGGYLLGLERELDGQKVVSWSHVFVRPSDQVDTSRTRRFGINTASIGMAREMRRCGFGWVRFENAKWMFFSDARDRYDFTHGVAPWKVPLDSYFADYQKMGMYVLPYVFMVPEWASSAPKGTKNASRYPPRDNGDYGEAIFQLVSRMGSAQVDPSRLKTADKKSGLNLINAVELWNEPNWNDPGWGTYVGTMSQYFDTMRAGVEGARRADPRLPVSCAGISGIDLAMVGLLADHHYADGKRPLDLIDIINVHYYSGRNEPETCNWDPNAIRDAPSRDAQTYPEMLEDLVAWRDQFKPDGEIWLTETGYDVGGPIGRTERVQATKLPRCVMLALAAGIDKVMIYRESGSQPAMHAGAGLLRDDSSVRPSWITVATMIRQLQGFRGRALRLPSDDPRVWLCLWEDGSRRLITGWRDEGTGKLGLDLGTTTVCDGFGRTTKPADTAGIVLSELPTYITLTTSSPACDALVAAGRARAKARASQRARLATLPMTLIDFGPPQQMVGLARGYGVPRRYTPVNKDVLWDDHRGYGWTVAALSDEDAPWVSDPRERDGCRVDKEHVFRLRLTPGRNHLRISAEPFAPTGVITVKVAGGEQKAAVTRENHVAEFDVECSSDPIAISSDGYFYFRWIEGISSKEP
jgi:hypothetical protein